MIPRSPLRRRYRDLRRPHRIALGLRLASPLGVNRRRFAPAMALYAVTEQLYVPPVVIAAGFVTYLHTVAAPSSAADAPE